MSHISMAKAGWQTQGDVLSGCHAAVGERRFDPVAGTDHIKKSVKKIKFTTATDPQRMVVFKVNHLPELYLQMVTIAFSSLRNE